MTYTALDEKFLTENTDIITEENLNENLFFNSENLAHHRAMAELPQGGYYRLNTALNRRQRRAYGRMLKKQLQAIDIRQIHPPCVPLSNRKTGEVTYPNGLQIRKDVTTNADTIAKFQKVIAAKEWEATKDQMMLIVLPEEYQYIDELTSVKVIYGLLDGNHRFKAITGLGEDVIFAWVLDMNLGEIWEFGNAFCNRDTNVVQPRTNADISNALVKTVIDPESDLHKLVEATKEEGYTGKSIDEILEDKLRQDYDVDGTQINAVLRIFNASEEHEYHSDIKRYYASEVSEWVARNRPGWVIMDGAKTSEGIYRNPETDQICFVYIDKGSVMLHTVLKLAKMVQQYPEKGFMVIHVISPEVANSYTEESIKAKDTVIKTEFYEMIKDIANLGNMLDTDKGVNIRHARLPLYPNEMTRNNLIYV